MMSCYKQTIILPILLSLGYIELIKANSRPASLNSSGSKPLLLSLSSSSSNENSLPKNQHELLFISIRGGGGSKKKTKKKTKRKKVASRDVEEKDEKEHNIESGKSVIKDALKEDPAIAMGNAIRDRASDLLHDDLTHPFHNNPHNDMTLNSIAYSLGSSEQSQQQQHRQKLSQSYEQSGRDKNIRIKPTSTMQDGGGVQPSSSAVIANYFLKSHGGLHGIQSIMSFLSVVFGISSFAVHPSPDNNNQQLSLKIRLIQRTLLCALSKHISGFIAAASASASRIPDIGWRETRLRMKSFALDPVSQYLFYCSLLTLWTNGVAGTFGSGDVSSSSSAVKTTATATTTTATTATVAVPWWLQGKLNFYCTLCLIGPILLREIISTIWVIADVLVLQLSSNLESSSTTKTHSSIVLKSGKTIIDSIMSLLLTANQWRGADAATKQRLLARLVARVSLCMEIGTGLILIYDAIRAFLDFSVSPVATRPSFLAVVKRVFCARLYINFIMVRRKKVIDLVNNIRGGFVHVPTRVLDTLLEPKKVMGLNWGEEEKKDDDDDDRKKSTMDWLGYLAGF